ncbi:TPA: flagellar biosynthesis protein FlgA [bacterium]|nr:flagellar biosynthesis protein FlgA [bacterium]
MFRKILITVLMALLIQSPCFAQPEVRVKDIARVVGVRSNQLVGYGLIVGLDGSGDSDKTLFTMQSVVSMMEKLGVTVDRAKLKVKNVAAVVVTAELPPFARAGDKIDITVSSLGDADSLEGGILLQTPLLAANSQVYAVAQGTVSLGGSNVNLMGGLRNYPTVGRIPQGAIVEREITSPILDEDKKSLSLALNRPDFTTISRLVKVINTKFTPATSKAMDASLIKVEIPREFKDDVIGFVASLEELTLTPDRKIRVIINERTGTIVAGGDATISKVAVSHGSLSLKVFEKVKIPGREARIEEKGERTVIMQETATVDNVVKALNVIGATPRDIIAIIQAIDAAGALHAELVLM